MMLWLLACASSPVPQGILVVSLDTLRADRLGAYGNTEGLTPNLDRFTDQSIVFENAYAASNETLYSHAALFTGQYPSRLAPLDGAFRIPTDVSTLAGVFHDAGWDTAAFVAGGHLSKIFGLNRGFDLYDDGANWGSLRDTTPKALRWLDTKNSQRPFLLFVHGYDTHDRYLKPTPFGYAFADPAQDGLGAELARRVGGVSQILDNSYEESIDTIELFSMGRPRFARGKGIQQLDPAVRSLTAEDKKLLVATYDGAVAWMDAWFGLFLAELEQRGLLDHLTIVVLSDHGEELGEEGVFHHRFGLGDATTHVPLMVRLPGAVGRRVPGLVSLVDIAPTLVEQAGLRGLKNAGGHSLHGVWRGAEDTGNAVVLSEGALRLTSARGPHARLVFEGMGAENPLSASVLAVAPLDGVSLSLTGDPAEVPDLRRALVTFRERKP